jgi:hypothetical protein
MPHASDPRPQSAQAQHSQDWRTTAVDLVSVAIVVALLTLVLISAELPAFQWGQ